MNTFETILEILQEKVLQEQIENLTPETRIDDIVLDSLDRVHLFVEIEAHYEITFPADLENKWEEAETLQDYINIIDSIIS